MSNRFLLLTAFYSYLINKMKPAKLHYGILCWFSVACCCWCTSDKFAQR